MSMVFDGVIVVGNADDMSIPFRGIHSSVELALGPITGNVYAIYPKHYRKGFDLDDEVAAQASKEFGKALLVQWDDRVGHDRAYLFENGLMTEEFDTPDKVYVLLGEDGEPLREGQKFKEEELREDEEYGCIRHAIDAGLDALGIGNHVTLNSLFEAFYKFG